MQAKIYQMVILLLTIKRMDKNLNEVIHQIRMMVKMLWQLVLRVTVIQKKHVISSLHHLDNTTVFSKLLKETARGGE
ncbi:hypothetical protein DICVIV_00344 [Dictyocaulus viviparus]|uniref:Uncharacterized protein n=1 Tax=Dictyocaulus viviparus TaxID=29172 RepID=A0A0D8YFI5_DICVI|nr:hypothetical protein DICVIV_00344 [Dictyocaulus viviparus]